MSGHKATQNYRHILQPPEIFVTGVTHPVTNRTVTKRHKLCDGFVTDL